MIQIWERDVPRGLWSIRREPEKRGRGGARGGGGSCRQRAVRERDSLQLEGTENQNWRNAMLSGINRLFLVGRTTWTLTPQLTRPTGGASNRSQDCQQGGYFQRKGHNREKGSAVVRGYQETNGFDIDILIHSTQCTPKTEKESCGYIFETSNLCPNGNSKVANWPQSVIDHCSILGRLSLLTVRASSSSSFSSSSSWCGSTSLSSRRQSSASFSLPHLHGAPSPSVCLFVSPPSGSIFLIFHVFSLQSVILLW